ncbi:daf-12-interacting protein 1-like [Mercenaria mercenaria]|uniref:daf-12-interacting protein 1-like n=1 Tax=Mercenaria mercenaria TaxID=6596 RepID=UPI00234F066F|nr:daf-12-interacting protein 1-like [Mercenaria mercenaria]
MDHRDQKRSISRTREEFSHIPHGRTSLPSSTETVTSERSLSGIQRQPSFMNTLCPSPTDDTNRPRPSSGHSSTSLYTVINRQSPDSGMKMTTQDKVKTTSTSEQTCLSAEQVADTTQRGSNMEMLHKTNCEKDQMKSFSVQRLGNEFKPTPNLGSQSSESTAGRHSTTGVSDAKADRRRKRREKKEREANKMEEERKKVQSKLEAERMMAELSRNRSMFNGNRDTLPAIGEKTAEVKFYIGKLPKVKEPKNDDQSLPDNNVLDVIKKHETQVRTTTFLKEVSQDYINAGAELIEPYNWNGAIDVIEKHEGDVGRTYAMYSGNYTTGSSNSTNSVCQPASARSRCSSGVSRRGAA